MTAVAAIRLSDRPWMTFTTNEQRAISRPRRAKIRPRNNKPHRSGVNCRDLCSGVYSIRSNVGPAPPQPASLHGRWPTNSYGDSSNGVIQRQLNRIYPQVTPFEAPLIAKPETVSASSSSTSAYRVMKTYISAKPVVHTETEHEQKG